MMKIILSLVFFVSATANAGNVSFKDAVESGSKPCEKEVSYLVERQEAPCTGYLFSPEKEYQVRVQVQRSDTLKSLTERQGEVIDIMEKRLDNMQKYNQYLSDELTKKDKYSTLEKFLYFGIGVLVTGAIATNVD